MTGEFIMIPKAQTAIAVIQMLMPNPTVFQVLHSAAIATALSDNFTVEKIK